MPWIFSGNLTAIPCRQFRNLAGSLRIRSWELGVGHWNGGFMWIFGLKDGFGCLRVLN